MKSKLVMILSLLTISMMVFPMAFAVKPSDCIVAKDIEYSASHYKAGQIIPLGFDEYGYNYQGHMFSGSYFNVYAGGDGYPAWDRDDEAYLAANPGAASHWAWPYREVNLVMLWNDAWISNADNYVGDTLTEGHDGKLDRHPGYVSYIGSGAWETNFQTGTNPDGSVWTYFCKIIAVPEGAYRVGAANVGTWYTAEGVEIGPDIWGQFAVIQEVYNDPLEDANGVAYLSPNAAGFGAYSP